VDRDRAADRVELAVHRALFQADAIEVEHRLAVLAEVTARLERKLDRDAVTVLRLGASCAKVARLLGISRQAVRKRLLPRAQEQTSTAVDRPGR